MSEHKSPRLASLDILRGIDMSLIIGLDALLLAVSALFGGTPDGWFGRQLFHCAWDGMRLYDLIFPTFLFIAGMSFPFSFAKQVEGGRSLASIRWRVIRRGLTLIALGLVYNGLLKFDFANLRWWSVLGRIGGAWMFAALLYTGIRSVGRRIALMATVLTLYALLNLLVVAPDAGGAGPLTPMGNVVCWVDRHFWPAHVYADAKVFDPEGLLGVIPATVTALFGMLAGDWFRRPDVAGGRKAACAAAAGAALVLAGWVASFAIPFNKTLWSSSFTLAAAGWSALAFALVYWLVDVRGWKRWGFAFTVIGVNPIVVYMAQSVNVWIPAENRCVNLFDCMNGFLFGGLAASVPSGLHELVVRAGYFICCWIFLLFLFRRKLFFKV